MELIAISVAAISAFFAAITAIANWRSVTKSQKVVESQIFLEFSDRYRRKEMSNAISKLADFWRENQGNEDLGKYFLSLEDQRYADEIYSHCRIMYSYFMYVASLYIAKRISRSLAIQLIDHPGLNVHYTVVQPIMLSKYPANKKIQREFVELKKLKKRFGDGIF